MLITEHIKDLVDVSGCERISILDTNYNDSEINITVCGLSCKFIHGDKYKNDRYNLAKIISSDNQFYDLIFSDISTIFPFSQKIMADMLYLQAA